MATPTSKYLKVQAFAAFGDDTASEEIVHNFTESDFVTGNRKVCITQELAASATDQSVNLSNYVDTATWIIIKDDGGTGLKVGHAAGAGKTQIAASKFLMFANGNSTPPTLYFDNVSGSNKAFLTLIVLGYSS